MIKATQEEYDTLSENAKMVLAMYSNDDGQYIDISDAFKFVGRCMENTGLAAEREDQPDRLYGVQEGLMELEDKGWVEQTNMDEYTIRKSLDFPIKTSTVEGCSTQPENSSTTQLLCGLISRLARKFRGRAS